MPAESPLGRGGFEGACETAAQYDPLTVVDVLHWLVKVVEEIGGVGPTEDTLGEGVGSVLWGIEDVFPMGSAENDGWKIEE